MLPVIAFERRGGRRRSDAGIEFVSVCLSVCLWNGTVRYRTLCAIGVASYWALGHVPPVDFQLVILGITRFTDSDESCARFSVQ